MISDMGGGVPSTSIGSVVFISFAGALPELLVELFVVVVVLAVCCCGAAVEARAVVAVALVVVVVLVLPSVGVE